MPLCPLSEGPLTIIEKFTERQKTESQKERTNQKTRRQRNGKSFIKELEREYKEIVMKVEDVLRLEKKLRLGDTLQCNTINDK